MFKTYFKYGVMDSGKSMELLSNAHNYKTKGAKTYFLSPKQDDRAGQGIIKARIGLKAKADFIIDKWNDALRNFIKQAYREDAVLFIDECQFVDYQTVDNLVSYCHYLDLYGLETDELVSVHLPKENFNLLAYGLLTDFNNKMFDGTRAWLEWADSIHEIKTVCHFCNHKATCNYLKPAVALKTDSNVVIGDSEFIPVCSRHYYKLMYNQKHSKEN